MSAPAKPLAPRAELSREPSRLVVRFRRPLAPRLAFAAFLCFLVAGVLAGLVAVASMLGTGRLEGPAATAAGMWLVALALGLGFAGWAFFRAVLATEVVEVGPDTLTLRRVAGPLRTGSAYELARVRNLRLEGRPGRTSLAFEHAGRTVRFGLGLGGAEAEEVLAALRERVRTA